MFRLPVDGEGLVDLHVLAGLDAAAAEDALIGIVAVEGIGMILLVRLAAEGPRLVLHVEVFDSVVDGAVAVVVVANGAVKVVILKDAIEGFALGHIDTCVFSHDVHMGSCPGGTGPNQRSIDFDHAGVACLDGTHGRVIADLGQMATGKRAVDRFDQ